MNFKILFLSCQSRLVNPREDDRKFYVFVTFEQLISSIVNNVSDCLREFIDEVEVEDVCL